MQTNKPLRVLAGWGLTETLPDPDGVGALSAPVTTYAYNAANWVTSTTDARGGVTAMTYDNLGRTARLTDPDGSGFLSASTTLYYYDFPDRIISKLDANSGTTSYTYDGEGDTRGHKGTHHFDDKRLRSAIYSSVRQDGRRLW